MALARLPTENRTGRTQAGPDSAAVTVPYRLVLPSRISTAQSRTAIADALRGLLLERRAFEQGDVVVVVRDRPRQQITGASSWKVNGLGDLKVITPTEVHFFGKSRWRHLLIANEGVLRSGPDPQLLLVASRRATAPASLRLGPEAGTA